MPVEWLVAALVLGVGAWLWTRRQRPSRAPAAATAPPPAPATPATLEPGDVLTFWDQRAAIVGTSFDCAEELHGRVTRWRWLLLDDGQVLQVVGDALTLFERSELLRQGTAAFRSFAAAADDGGLLQLFEARVRAGAVASEPVHWPADGGEYELRSSGTFQATWRGAPPSGVWADVSSDATQNVYFTFEGRGGAVDGVLGLGVWTSHVLLLCGRPLPPADVLGCYRPDDASRSTR
ncbi:MAG: hypothetical protein HYU88_08390 [Chloroflexi bacterium]|nr:hypothetical protein [Chloroflexota bacterium]MBI4506319.1 hypothetical protein [Chloroflexota bacterium]